MRGNWGLSARTACGAKIVAWASSSNAPAGAPACRWPSADANRRLRRERVSHGKRLVRYVDSATGLFGVNYKLGSGLTTETARPSVAKRYRFLDCQFE
jgi:hypothetical protein